ncbi:hypothetical protein [Paenibacillus kandeliae]|uniref:hypothetical protein n=1 Tax=Paenibacillus kandeliae TaxID=3231269 RepID=UPI00345A7FD0
MSEQDPYMSTNDPYGMVESVDRIISSKKVKNIGIGSSVTDLSLYLGESNIQPAKINRRSNVYCYVYENISFFVEAAKVIAIDIDVHGKNKHCIELGEMANWNLDHWFDFAKTKAWEIEEISDITHIYGDGLKIALSPAGELGMISIRSS